MFDALVPEYDLFNRISSLGLDASWRREAAGRLAPGSNVLDVGTGTGDLAEELVRRQCRVEGIDLSETMVSAARKKLAIANASFRVASADQLPFDAGVFDGVVSAFVLRNLHKGGVMEAAFREFFRVLKPGGKMVHVELTRPSNRCLSAGHRMYRKTILPLVGKLLFGRRWPGRYLDATIEQFPDTSTLCEWMRWAGFDRVGHTGLHGGIAGIFIGEKC